MKEIGFNMPVPVLRQKFSAFFINLEIYKYGGKNYKCEYAMFFQNISESLMKNKKINAELHLESQDKEIQEYAQKDIEENCKKFDNEEAKIILLNIVHYELAINIEFNQWKEVLDRVEVLLSDWFADYWTFRFNLWQLSEEAFLKKNASKMLDKIKHFTSEKTNRESISIIEALIGKEFNLGSLSDQIKTLVEETIPEEEANLEILKKYINTEQLEKEIKFLKKNPKSIGKKEYQKTVAIICTIKQLGKKVEMLKSKIKTKILKINELSSRIENYKINYIGPELWEQMEESCNQLKPKHETKEIASEEILLKDFQFEFDEIWKSFRGIWGGIEKYYLKMPLMQLKEQARTLAKTFGKMLQNVKELYAQKMDESNVGGDMIMSE